jgi:type IV secretory pathway TrbF-like protein
MAWQDSRGEAGFLPIKTLGDELIWGTAATQHAVSWPHVDDEGFATMVSVQVGSKYWMVGRHKVHPIFRQDDGIGNVDTINAFGVGIKDRSWVPATSNTSQWDYEGILLTPGMVL